MVGTERWDGDLQNRSGCPDIIYKAAMTVVYLRSLGQNEFYTVERG
jgi:hypothetical protein